RNTVGNIPMNWYDDYPHIGYNLGGKKIPKPLKTDELDNFLKKMDDPNFWRTVTDKTTGKEIVLTDEELALIQRIQDGNFPDASYDPYQPYEDFFTREQLITPLSNKPEPKSKFIPSKWEHKRVMKIVRAIRNGWIRPRVEKDAKPQYYLLWDKEGQQKDHPMHIPAPKLKMPGSHEESYNPPPEYLPNEKEIQAWIEKDPEDRALNFLPKKYQNLRTVPAYNKFIQERFERCLDLYLCPRQKKDRIQIDPDELLPKLPKPADLQPFPSSERIVYKGHTSIVRSISLSPSGRWMVSGHDDKTVRFWDVDIGRCIKTITFEDSIMVVSWCPNPMVNLVLIACGQQVRIINPALTEDDKAKTNVTDEVIKSIPISSSQDNSAKWIMSDENSYNTGERIVIKCSNNVDCITWHNKGDYFATVHRKGGNKSVLVHQLSKARTQVPFKRCRGLVQCVQFHPNKPFMLVATQTYIRIYNLVKQQLAKKLSSGVKWISSLAVHPQGDNIIIGSYDARLCWFDVDLSTKPYKTLRQHKMAIRSVVFHKCYPLFASASDDGTVIICHGRVFNDLMQNPLIVPVKILRSHTISNDLGVLDCTFHPSEPWLLSAGADGTIRLYS
ncbi:uncharacterized protein TRIADDRAFT_20780, partial [Trichoplax adhaerens]